MISIGLSAQNRKVIRLSGNVHELVILIGPSNDPDTAQLGQP